MDKFELLKELLLQNDDFLITTHVNPDPDAICSELAIYLVLKKLGKRARVVNHSATPYNLDFLDKEKVIEKYDLRNHSTLFSESKVIIMLDLNSIDRVVSMEKSVRSFGGIKICIDHHQDPEATFDYYFGNTEYSATGEILYDLIKSTGIVELDYGIACQLYTAIMTDTGSFRFERTGPKIHLIAAELLRLGVNPTEIYDRVYDQFRFNRLKLLGDALRSVKLDDTGLIAHMILTREDLERNNAVEADLDGFVNYCLSIQGVKVGILFYELKDGVKISFRSKGETHVNKIAARFGGGGHFNASGARLFNTSLNKIVPLVLEETAKLFH